jgi:hypothetical protein
MRSRGGGKSAALMNRIARLDVTLQQDQPSFGATELRPRNPIPYGLETLSSWFQRLEGSSQGRGGSRSLLRVRPMEEGRKSSLSYRPGALPKPFVPSGRASIGIIAAPLSESLFVKRWP